MSHRIAPVVGIALCAGLSGCLFGSDQPMPHYELAPTNDAVRQVMMARFTAAHDPAGAACTADFSVSAIEIKEQAWALVTRERTYDMSDDIAYVATLLRPAANLQAQLRACFDPLAQPPGDWPVGQPRPVLVGADIKPAGGAWTLVIPTTDDNNPVTIPMANAAPHPFRIGFNGNPIR